MDKALETLKNEQNPHRAEDYIETGRFFENYRKDIRRLFDVLDWEWSDDPAEVNAQLHKMIGADHSDTSGLQQFTPEQIEAGMAIAEEIGFIQEILPSEPTDYKKMLLLGATKGGIELRLGVRSRVLAAGSTAQETIFLNGRRPRITLDGTDEEIIEAFGVSKDNPWIRHELQQSEPFATETHMGRAAALGLLDNPMGGVHRMDLPLLGTPAAKREAGAESRDITDYYYRNAEGHEIIIVNGRAVDRGKDDNGNKRPPRPTTESTIQEYLERHTPAEGDVILVVLSQPHTLRMAREIKEAFKEHGLSGVTLDIASASAPAGTKLQTILGEIARMMDREQQAQQNKQAGTA